MQKWEYQTIRLDRGWSKDTSVKGARWYIAGKWDVNITEELVKLGDEGWELTAISPRSSYLGGFDRDSAYADYAGFTDQELWVFKRPKQ